jgi:hypothetical protein
MAAKLAQMSAQERHTKWKWKNHHHNSKVVRKRFSILPLYNSPGWHFSYSTLKPSFFSSFFFISEAQQKKNV